MKKKVLNAAMIGCGNFMAYQHLPNVRKDPRYRIHTLCDLDRDLLARREREFGPARTCTDAGEVFADPEIDVVFIGTKEDARTSLILRAAEAGKHMFVEKPMTATNEETAAVLEAVRGSGVTLGIGFNRRYSPIMTEAKNHFESYRRGPASLLYRIVCSHPRPCPEEKRHLLVEGCHIFDLVAWFLGEEPIEVFAGGTLQDDNPVLLKMSGGSDAFIYCGSRGGYHYPKELMEVFCNGTTLAADQFFELRIDGPGVGRNVLKNFPVSSKSDHEPEEKTMTGFYRLSWSQRRDQETLGPGRGLAAGHLYVNKGHEKEIAAFAEAIAAGRPFAPGVVEGARATVCALKAYESIAKNRPVHIEPSDYGA